MTIDPRIRDKKGQHDLNSETGKISLLSSGKNDEYEYLSGKGTLSPDLDTTIEQARFTHSSLGNE